MTGTQSGGGVAGFVTLFLGWIIIAAVLVVVVGLLVD